MHLKSSAFPALASIPARHRSFCAHCPPSLAPLLQKWWTDTFSVCPLMKEHSLLPEAGIRSTAGAAVPSSSMYSSLPPLAPALARCSWQTNKAKQMGFNEGSQECKSLILHQYSPILCFFLNFIYLGRAISWRILAWDQNQMSVQTCISLARSCSAALPFN